jgi:hypothetical protein
MLRHPHADRRDVEHLPVFPAHLHRSAQTLPAAPAAARLVHDDLVGDRDRGQRRPRMTGLPTGLTGTALAQRLWCRLGQPIRTRRLRGILRRLPQPSLQLSDPHPRRTQLRRQRLDQLIPLREPLKQLHNRQRLGHREIINTPDDKIKPPRRPPGPDQLPQIKPKLRSRPEPLSSHTHPSVLNSYLTLSRFATWDEHQIAICPAPLEAGESLIINIITSGPGYDLRAIQVPHFISDIRVARVTLKDFIEDSLGKIKHEYCCRATGRILYGRNGGQGRSGSRKRHTALKRLPNHHSRAATRPNSY